jgi:hypothetical protein
MKKLASLLLHEEQFPPHRFLCELPLELQLFLHILDTLIYSLQYRLDHIIECKYILLTDMSRVMAS